MQKSSTERPKEVRNSGIKSILKTKPGKVTTIKHVKFSDAHTVAPAPIPAPNNNKSMRKNTRRGKRHSTTKTLRNLKLLTFNTNGIKSKINSLTSALHRHGTHIAAITETHLNDSETLTIPGYKWIGKNRTSKTGGGIGFLIRNDISNITCEDPNTKEENNTETLWIKIRSKTTINIAVTYGPQENYRKEQTERYYHNLTTDTIRRQKEASAIIMGDLNAKLKIYRDRCQQEGSRNGTMLQNYLDTTNMTVVNKLNKHTGNWTRVNRKRPDEKSIIDYILISQPLSNKVIESNTDEQGIYQITGENATDHNTITCTLNTEMIREQQSTRKWKKGDDQGRDKF